MSWSRSIAVAMLVILSSSALCAEEVKIGDRVGKLKFTDIRSLPRTLDDFGAKKAFVLVFTNTSCPVVQRYLPTLQELENTYRDKDVQFVAINSAEEDTLIAMATQAVKYEMEFPFVKDFDGACARALGVKRTPEVVVLDGEKRLCYRGRIDDQHRVRGSRKEPTTRELKDALDSVLAGRKVAVSETEVDGCAITFAKPRKPKDVNFAEHVAPILQKHCWECHKAGGSAPFALTSYKQAAARADTIAEVITDQRMPPWFALHDYGPFITRRGLSDDERSTVIDWVRGGTAPGDLIKVPAAPAEPKSKWQIETPDLILDSQEFELPAKGDIPYKYAILPHPFAEETWVQSVQIITDNPRSLHHANLAFFKVSEGFKEENFITGYVPGGSPMMLDKDVAFGIPKGSVLGLQIHFVPTGKPEKCKVTVGLRFPRDVVQKRLKHIQLYDKRFAIPPGAPAHKVSATRVLDTDVIGVGMFSHMHLRGKDMTFTAHLPDGKRDTLLIIANYNFAWQVAYQWEPGKKRLPKGTRLECVAHFDNSPFNPFNPDPKATVRNGPQTHNEMMYGFFFYTDADEKLGLKIDPKTGTVTK
ncbi:MAG: redoxin family protein [Planctomycetia bacterium]|nr:redoxin family protein [Planctomycetia bacterium]